MAAVNRDHQVPKTVSWSFDIQQRLPKDVLFNITYAGNRGLNLIGFRELNQLNPEYLSLGAQLNSAVPNPFLGRSRSDHSRRRPSRAASRSARIRSSRP